MMKKYKSKISIGLILFLLLLFGFIGFEIFSEPMDLSGILFGVFILFVPVLLIVYSFISISYIILKGELSIKAGFLVNEKIEIASIKRIEETNNIVSSPAASFDRLEIFYNSLTV